MVSKLLGLVVLAALASAQQDIVQTPLGPVRGVVLQHNRVFLGIPYAEPPVGQYRWAAPPPVAAWAPAVLDATQDPPGCWQRCAEPPHACPGTVSEDCLRLNVWTPLGVNATSSLPVLVFLHGGNFRDGGVGGLSTALLYDGTSLNNVSDVIVVTVQYRLGALGFLFVEEGAGRIGGNAGLMDQEAALQWVQDNIAAFGGDPSRVMLYGQSAGAQSVGCHLSRGTGGQGKGKGKLYAAAGMISLPFGLPFRDPQSAQNLTRITAVYANCSSNSTIDPTPWPQVEDCLRALPADQILAAQLLAAADVRADLDRLLQIFEPFGPVHNTSYLPLQPLDAFQAGAISDVPLMIGTTEEEAILFIYEASPKPVSVLEYEAFIAVLLGLDYVLDIAAQYPIPSPAPADLRPQLAQIATDALFGCASRNATEAALAAGRTSPIYLYRYNHVESFAPTMWGPNFTMCWNASCHGSDLVQHFRPEQPALGTNYTAEENVLAWQMQSYWGALAAAGAAGAGYPGAPLLWPAYDVNSKATMMYRTAADGGITIAQGLQRQVCTFWDTVVGYNFY